MSLITIIKHNPVRRYTNKQLYDLVRDNYDFSFKTSINLSIAGKCFFDERRTLTLMNIISETTIPGAVGADLGAGTGILGFSFLNAGGGLLYSVDNTEGWHFFIRRMVRILDFEEKIRVFNKNAATFKPPKNVDYVMAELVYTGILKEPLVQAIFNIRKYTNPFAKFVPEGAVSTVKISDGEKDLSKPVEYDSIKLPWLIKPEVQSELDIPVTTDGIPSYAVIETRLTHPNGRVTETFDSLCQPRYLPVRYHHPNMHKLARCLRSTNDDVKEGQILSFKILYKYGSRRLSLGLKLKS